MWDLLACCSIDKRHKTTLPIVNILIMKACYIIAIAIDMNKTMSSLLIGLYTLTDGRTWHQVFLTLGQASAKAEKLQS